MNGIYAADRVCGVPMSVRSARPAQRFMNAQIGICCLMLAAALTSIIFSYIIASSLSDVGFTDDGKGREEGLDAQHKQMGDMMMQSRSWALFSLLEVACIGGIIVTIARVLLEQRKGIRICCIVEGILAGCECCACIGYASLLIFVYILYLALDDPEKVCTERAKLLPSPTSMPSSQEVQVAAVASGVSKASTTTSVQSDCEAMVKAMAKPLQICIAWISILACISMCTVGACSAGAKFADDTDEAFEDDAEPGRVFIEDSDDGF